MARMPRVGGVPMSQEDYDRQGYAFNTETGNGQWVGSERILWEEQLQPGDITGNYTAEQAAAMLAELQANPVPSSYGLRVYNAQMFRARVQYHGFAVGQVDLPKQRNKPENPGIREVAFSTHGTPIPISFGSRRVYGNVIDSTPLVPSLVGTEVKNVRVEIPFVENDAGGGAGCGAVITGSGDAGGGADCSNNDPCSTRSPDCADVPPYNPAPPPGPGPEPEPEPSNSVVFRAGSTLMPPTNPRGDGVIIPSDAYWTGFTTVADNITNVNPWRNMGAQGIPHTFGTIISESNIIDEIGRPLRALVAHPSFSTYHSWGPFNAYQDAYNHYPAEIWLGVGTPATNTILVGRSLYVNEELILSFESTTLARLPNNDPLDVITYTGDPSGVRWFRFRRSGSEMRTLSQPLNGPVPEWYPGNTGDTLLSFVSVTDYIIEIK